MATEMSREHLISTVQKMEQGGESKETIDSFVREYKRRQGEQKQVLPEKPPSLYEAVFPRSHDYQEKKEEIGPVRGAIKGVADLASLPGRTAASLPALLTGEGFKGALAKTESEHTGAPGFVGDVARDPITGLITLASMGVGAGVSPALSTGLKGLVGQGAKHLVRGGIEGLVSGVGHELERYGETGEFDPVESVKRVGLEAGTSAVMEPAQAALGAISRKGLDAIQGTPAKIMASNLKATAPDVKAGYRPENVVKYGLMDNAENIVERSGKMIQDRVQQVNERLAAAAGSTPPVNVRQVIADAIETLSPEEHPIIFANVSPSFVTKEKAGVGLMNLANEITGGMDEVDIVTADKVKKAIGNLGKWARGQDSADQKSMEAIANAVYMRLREAINAADPEIARLNTEISELIPIRSAANRRLPIEQRLDGVSLGEQISLANMLAGEEGMGPAELLVSQLRRLSRSPMLAEAAQYARPGASFAETALDALGGPAALATRTGVRTQQSKKPYLPSQNDPNRPPASILQ